MGRHGGSRGPRSTFRRALAAAGVAALVAVVVFSAGVSASSTAVTDGAGISVAAASSEVTNGTVAVTVAVTNTGDRPLSEPSLAITAVPEGWEVIGQSATSATWRPGTRTWLWLPFDPGERRTVELWLAPTAETESGRIEFRARGNGETVTVSAPLPAVSADAVPDSAPAAPGPDVAEPPQVARDGGSDGAVPRPRPSPGLPVLPALLAGVAGIAGVALGRTAGQRGRRLAAQLGVGGVVAGLFDVSADRVERAAGDTARYYVYLLAALVAGEALGLGAFVRWTGHVVRYLPALAGGVALLVAGGATLRRPDLSREARTLLYGFVALVAIGTVAGGGLFLETAASTLGVAAAVAVGAALLARLGH